MRRENEGLKTTVSAQGKEVERLQRENETLRGDIETHKLTVGCFSMWEGGNCKLLCLQYCA